MTVYAVVGSKSIKETNQEMRYLNVTSPYFATPLVFNGPDGGVPWDDLRNILHGGMAKVQNSKKIAKSLNPLSRAHECCSRQMN